ncbi:MAG: hypothetical protein ACPL7O_08185, partial [Armatimonadota bacterium]
LQPTTSLGFDFTQGDLDEASAVYQQGDFARSQTISEKRISMPYDSYLRALAIYISNTLSYK